MVYKICMNSAKLLDENGNIVYDSNSVYEDLGGSNMNNLVIIAVYALFFGGLWFLLIRPQKKEQKRVQLMLSELEVGDTILTTSGFYGVVIDITENDVIVEFGSNKNCRIPMQKQAIMQVEKPGAAQ